MCGAMGFRDLGRIWFLVDNQFYRQRLTRRRVLNIVDDRNSAKLQNRKEYSLNEKLTQRMKKIILTNGDIMA